MKENTSPLRKDWSIIKIQLGITKKEFQLELHKVNIHKYIAFRQGKRTSSSQKEGNFLMSLQKDHHKNSIAKFLIKISKNVLLKIGENLFLNGLKETCFKY